MTATHDSLRRPQVIALAVALASVAFIGGLLIAPTSTRDHNVDATGTAADASDPKSAPGPAEYRWGIPLGFARTAAGARAAAASYVLTGAELMAMAPSQIPDAIELMSSTASAAARLAEAQAKLAELRKVLSSGRGPTRYVQAVLAVRVDAFDTDRARVSVWSVGVLSREGAAAPQAGWSTSTFELVWERDDWKIWSEQIQPGPTPDLNGGEQPVSAVDLERRLQGFTIWETGR